MPLATLTYIPANHGDNTTRRASISSALNWRRLLPSSTARRKNERCHSSPTALAGATEKFIRHRPSEISCGDLTASEFAMLAGIPTMAIAGAASDDELSCGKSEREFPSPKIWDQDFWLHPSTSTSATTASSALSNDDDSCHPHPIHRNSAPNIILRGRFQICVGEDTSDDTPVSLSAPPVFEWKRKKSL
ncbi:hypothetical protein BX666DRAFT_1952581 [Dichotomocladium elegans]|nr:hypothetical protein BX666DRAFT_1952581 [Dichotomocladium elegans]